MRKTARNLVALVFTAVMLLSMALPVSAAGASIKLNASKKTLVAGGSAKLKATVKGKIRTTNYSTSGSALGYTVNVKSCRLDGTGKKTLTKQLKVSGSGKLTKDFCYGPVKG